jgi:hypothetical protein
MAKDESGARWPAWPVYGAVGANGNYDPVAGTAYVSDFTLTPSGLAEQEAAQPAEEVPDEGPE